MAKVFLDTNYFIGFANKTPEVGTEIINRHVCFISTLSCHILFYINKINVPDIKTNDFIDDFNIVNFTDEILNNALLGPTNDLKDNVQLFSALENNCEIFLTFDKKLLKMGVFGKMRLQSTL